MKYSSTDCWDCWVYVLTCVVGGPSFRTPKTDSQAQVLAATVLQSAQEKHAMKFQGVITPDGLFVDLWGSVAGTGHDSFILA